MSKSQTSKIFCVIGKDHSVRILKQLFLTDTWIASNTLKLASQNGDNEFYWSMFRFIKFNIVEKKVDLKRNVFYKLTQYGKQMFEFQEKLIQTIEFMKTPV